MIRIYTRADAGKQVSPHYHAGDFFVHKAMDTIRLDDALVSALEQFYRTFGKPMFPSPNALYRTAVTNKACGGAKSSQHLYGRAADFWIEGVAPVALAQYAERLGMGGIGVYRGARHIHMDTRPGKARWWLKTSGSKTPGFGGIPCVFRKGHRSPAIAEIQRGLNRSGFACGATDGCWGANTDQAFRAWQKANGLKTDGVFGRLSNARMGLFEWDTQMP